MAKDSRLHAYAPLADAVTACGRLGHTRPVDAADWRVNYFAAIGLLRTVGHVLDKIDAKKWPATKQPIAAAYARWKRGEGEDAIFQHFIEDERNLLLKEYRRGCEPEDAVDCPVLTVDGNEAHGISTIPVVFVEGGRFDGEPVEALLWRAVEWWMLELEAIEVAATGTSNDT